MTTPTITDEQIAEIEALADAAHGWQLPDAFLNIDSETPSDDWQWCVGAIQDGEQYPVMEVNTWQYDSDAAEYLARYYAAVNRKSILALISRLRAAERDAKRWKKARDILTVEAIETAQSDFINFGLPAAESESLRADKAIDAAMAQPEPNHPT